MKRTESGSLAVPCLRSGESNVVRATIPRMRRIALALLVAATGCNQVFGVHRTKHVDAPPDSPDAPPDAAWLPIIFDQQLGTTDTTGAPLPAMQLAFASPPTVQVGSIGGALQPLTYDSSIPGVRVPPEIVQGPWRLVYQLPDDQLPIEIQWSASSAHLTLPSIQRSGDMLPPTSSGYKITPGGTPSTGWTTFGQPQIATSGAFTDSAAGAPGSEIDFAYATKANAILGSLGTPHSTAGDWVALLDWRLLVANNATGTLIYGVNGYALSAASDLTAGTLTSSTPTWVTTPSSYNISPFGSLAVQTRLQPFVFGGACCTYHLQYGLLPNANITPMSLKANAAGTNYLAAKPPPPGLELPVMITLYSYNDATTTPTTITLADPPSTAIKLPRSYYARVALENRIVMNNSIETSVQEVSPATSYQFAAPLALGAMLASTPLTTGAPVKVTLPASGPAVLTWTAESNHSADDYVVTLYKVLDQMLVPLARYQVLQPSVSVDTSLMQPGNTYLFGIVSRNGFPRVKGSSPDYSVVSLPFSEATTFPLEFTIQ